MKKVVIFISIFLLTISIVFGLYFIWHKEYKCELNGSSNILLRLGEIYEEEGITAKYGNYITEEDLEYEIISNLDINKVGEYKIIYRIKKNNEEFQRLITVIDDIPPVIESVDSVEILSCQANIDIEYIAMDNYDDDITNLVERTDFDDYILLTVKDSSQNETSKRININKKKESLPKLTLNGNATVYVATGKNYTEKGAVATDECGNNLEVKISSNVNTTKVGNYRVNYTVENKLGETASISRKVVVYSPTSSTVSGTNSSKVIYLTFDDGPGKYTAQILDILKERNVKATFFVTNQFPAYQNMITREYNEGHVVGIHTYSHNYKTIYSSVEGFMNDLNKMNEIIHNKTGKYSNIMRFAGGSSNTVSRSYATGIMTALATKVTEEGYLYFDWNLNSGDTNGMTAKQIYNNTISSLGNGSKIILMHDIKYNTLVALPDILDYALANGYKFDVLSSQSMTVHSKINN